MRARGEACTPAAQTTVCVAMRSMPVGDSTSMPSPSMLVTRVPVRTWTPMRSSAVLGFQGQAITERPEDLLVGFDEEHDSALGSIARKSFASVRRASSAICPATSHPVGPPPTTAKVSHLRRSASDGADSASSNAAKIRRRRLRASSIVFIGSEWLANSSRPKYEVVDPDATIRLS